MVHGLTPRQIEENMHVLNIVDFYRIVVLKAKQSKCVKAFRMIEQDTAHIAFYVSAHEYTFLPILEPCESQL